MDCTTLKLIAAGLFLLWLFAPVAVIVYRTTTVPKRYQEIVDRFMQAPAPDRLAPDPHNREKSGAWHYARLFDPDCDPSAPGELEDPIKKQFFHFHGWSRYAVPLGLMIGLSGLMLAFSGFWLADALSPLAPIERSANPTEAVQATGTTTNLPAQIPKTSSDNSNNHVPITGLSMRVKPTFILALWGAFVWSLYEILNRKNTGDLSPVELYDVAFRFATAVPIGYAFSLLVGDTIPGFLAFAISAFPLRDVQQLLRKQALQKLGQTPQASSALASQGYLNEVMTGMGNNTIARLQELNIETYLDLAYTDPIKLLIKTGVPIQLVLAWIDQALLAVYAAPHKSKFEQLGMPCALDLCEFYARHCFDVDNNKERDWANAQAVKDLAAALSTKEDVMLPELLVHQLLLGIFEDPHSQFLIRVWNGPAKTSNAM